MSQIQKLKEKAEAMLKNHDNLPQFPPPVMPVEPAALLEIIREVLALRKENYELKTDIEAIEKFRAKVDQP